MSTPTTASTRVQATSPPDAVLDHAATPEWDTTQHSDLCDTCGWPVSRSDEGTWTPDQKNPAWWIDRRWTKNTPGSYSTTADHGVVYTAYRDGVSSDIARMEWRVVRQETLNDAPVQVGFALTLRNAKTLAQRHHNQATGQAR